MLKLKGTDIAPDDCVFVCFACGKISRSRYGFDINNKKVCMFGWDESCMMNCDLFKKTDLIINENGAVTGLKENVKPVPFRHRI